MNKPANILVVDDELAIASLVATLLSQEGMTVTTCTSGEEALETFHANTFDLAILDIMMPGIDGFELCRKLRETSSIPIIFLSAKDEETDKVIGFMLGADDYVSKPFKSRELIARVKARLRRTRTLDAVKQVIFFLLAGFYSIPLPTRQLYMISHFISHQKNLQFYPCS